jgi:Ni/Co efflux regulator RcnB
MKQRIISALLVCTCLSVSAAAFADDHDHRGGPPQRHDNRGHDQHFGPYEHPDHPGPGADNRGGRPMHWNRGDRVPPEYRGRQYIVSDWRSHRLAPPPRGQQWVSVGADYFLVGVATGVVMQSIFGQ